jgi:hypothetical protein
MEKGHFSDHQAGAKTLWIIDFTPGEKPALYIPPPPGTPAMAENAWVDTTNLEDLKKNYGQFLAAIAKLCSLIESRKEETKSIDSSINSLKDIINKFNEMLRRMRRKDDSL